MSNWIKGVIGALMLTGSTLVASEPAQARVSVGIGIGIPGPGYYGPGYYGGSDYSAYCDPPSRYYDPDYCDGAYDDGYYGGPVFIDGFWFDGPFRSRFNHGRREFYHHNNWREGRWGGRGHDRDFGRGRGMGGHWGGQGGHHRR